MTESIHASGVSLAVLRYCCSFITVISGISGCFSPPEVLASSLCLYMLYACSTMFKSAVATRNCFSPSPGIKSGKSEKLISNALNACTISCAAASGTDTMLVFPSVKLSRSFPLNAPPVRLSLIYWSKHALNFATSLLCTHTCTALSSGFTLSCIQYVIPALSKYCCIVPLASSHSLFSLYGIRYIWKSPLLLRKKSVNSSVYPCVTIFSFAARLINCISFIIAYASRRLNLRYVLIPLTPF